MENDMRKTCIMIVLAFLLISFACVFVIQLVPYGHNHTNPPVLSEPNWPDPQTKALATRACFDCHSNLTIWPWYTNIAPISWLIQRDVDEGRRRLNFSDWNNRPRGGRERDLSQIVLEGEMPPLIYLPVHPTANLTAAERQQLAQGLSQLK